MTSNNNIPQGYKQTELGIIPEDWEVVTIQHIADISTGNKNTQDAEESGKYPFYVRSQNVERINSYCFDCEGVVTAGDGVGTGKIFHFVRGKFALHQRAYLIYNFKGLDPLYFYSYFSQNFYERINQMTAKSSVDSVRKEMIENMQILKPPLAEQKAIATALSDVDALIVALDKKIEKKKLIKQGAMQQLLAGKKRLPGFTDKWVISKLGDAGTLLNGYAFKSETYNLTGKYMIITISNVQNGKLVTNECNKVAAPPSDIQRHQLLKKNDILISMTGNVGRVCMVNTDDCLLNQRVGLFELKDSSKYDKNFIYTIINSQDFETTMIESSQGAAQSNINKKDIEDYVFIMPRCRKEQQVIADVFFDMDKEISDLVTKRDKYRQIKSGMMQKLLTGQIRLK